MSGTWPRITRRVYPSGATSFKVDLGEIEGKRQRRFFPTKDEAESFAEQARVLRQNEGLSAFSMPQELRVDALNASRLLEPCRVSLTVCAEYYLKHVVAFRDAPKIPEIVVKMLKEAESNQRRDRTIQDLRCRLNAFATDFQNHRLTDLTVEQIREWVMDEDWEPRTQINYLTKISQLFNFGILHTWATLNLAERIARPSVQDSEAQIFSVEQAQRLLEHAPAFGLMPYVALSLFCGLRSAELLRLDWKNVSFPERCVVVGAHVAKKRSRRVVQMPQTLAAWVDALSVPKEGPVVDSTKFRKNLEELGRAAGIAKWPRNGLRHSFGSYHLAMHGDVVKTADQMGNKSDVVHKHYKALVFKSDAERYWSLTPKAVPLCSADMKKLAA